MDNLDAFRNQIAFNVNYHGIDTYLNMSDQEITDEIMDLIYKLHQRD